MTSFTLKPKDTIGVMAPSSFVEKDDIEKSRALLEGKGYRVVVHPQTFARQHQSAGSAAEKIKALHALYADQGIHAIWAAGGGNRALGLLDGLDYDLIGKNPKPLIGFSDATALLNPLYAHTGHEGFHAQVFKNLHLFDQLEETLAVLSGGTSSLNLHGVDILQDGLAEGPILGGCLSLFHYLPGTNDCPNLQGAILLLEDTGDALSRFDRMFIQMKRMGAFEQIGGLILGRFDDLREGGRPFGFTLEDIVLEALDGRDIPVVMNAPFGHGARLLPVPIGRPGTLDTQRKLLSFPLRTNTIKEDA
ncbi:MAG: LD-carboxypeptidase [Rhodospirillales bacterium]|nr:LD-carboxypeptidase [Rhodospirillales bacterium]